MVSFKNSRASRYLVLNMMDMCFPCKAIVENDTKELCFCNFYVLAIEFC